ncbi:hypothetical protein K402DRAFT_394710 [Aulographum hederae CBS 113979]|uniref:Uncharacterized protein n=1 Tax=Aulographum hederae CBS 113979 TaxID=1176131 RepID=A0A6G1GX50_9PEZI|nr:hypothetical protein K402DRAFT_394710 [Aulographum hederae CBS 113979]
MAAESHRAVSPIDERSVSPIEVTPPQATDYEPHAQHHHSEAASPREPHEKNQQEHGERHVRLASPEDVENGAKEAEKLPRQSRFAAHRNRLYTNLNDAPVKNRSLSHKYLIRRPRPLQVHHDGRTIEIGDTGRLQLGAEERREVAQNHGLSGVEFEGKGLQGRSTESLVLQRDRLDLFVDLIWVGIISNISEHYYSKVFAEGASVSSSTSEFIVLFLPAWRMWSSLQQYLNSYYMDDLLQRVVIIWYLLLGLTWGNNAPYFLDNAARSNFSIVTYIIAIDTLLLAELAYSIWIPWLRRRFLIGLLLGIGSTAMWVILSITDNENLKTSLLVAVIVFDYATSLVLASPLGALLLGKGPQKAEDTEHTVKRYESFFIIALGEGVFILIRGSPLGSGLTNAFWRGVLALIIYYNLNWLYFNGDQTKTFIHAMSRRWYIKAAWHLFHIPLFGALVILSSGILYVVGYAPEQEAPESSTGTESGSQGENSDRALFSRAEKSEPEVSYTPSTLHIAETTICVCLSIILLTQLVISLLNRSFDAKKTLVVNNRYFRLLPRAGAIIALALMWLTEFENPTVLMGWLDLILGLVSFWEWYAGMERGARILEPKEEWSLADVSGAP